MLVAQGNAFLEAAFVRLVQVTARGALLSNPFQVCALRIVQIVVQGQTLVMVQTECTTESVPFLQRASLPDGFFQVLRPIMRGNAKLNPDDSLQDIIIRTTFARIFDSREGEADRSLFESFSHVAQHLQLFIEQVHHEHYPEQLMERTCLNDLDGQATHLDYVRRISRINEYCQTHGRVAR